MPRGRVSRSADIARASDSRTVIAALVPGRGRLDVNQAPYLLFVDGTARDEAYLLGVLSSMILDWYARRVIELHHQLLSPQQLPHPRAFRRRSRRAAGWCRLAGRLAAVDDRYAEWAAEVGVQVGTVTDDETRQDLICELDACVAHLYGLDEDDLAVIYKTFHTGDNYSAHHARVLEHFRNPPTAVAATRDDAAVV